jgi:secreted Zn-dependent insulinase-like peptidase
VELRVDGFSHKLPALAQKLLRTVADCEVGAPAARARCAARVSRLGLPAACVVRARRRSNR